MPLFVQDAAADNSNLQRLTFTPSADVWVLRMGVVSVNELTNYGLAIGPGLEGQSIPWIKQGASAYLGDALIWNGFLASDPTLLIAGYFMPSLTGRVRFWVDYVFR